MIDGLGSDDFILEVDFAGGPDAPPRAANLKRSLNRWLNSLDTGALGSESPIPAYEYSEGGWSAVFKAWPAEAGGDEEDPETLGFSSRTLACFEPVSESERAQRRKQIGTDGSRSRM